MATQGPNSPSTGATSGTGAVWSSGATLSTAINAQDAVFATASYSVSSAIQFLVATNFGFAIPGGATINGVQAEFYRKMSGGANDVLDSKVYLVKGGTIMSGTTNKSTGASWNSVASYISFGGSADLWGNTLTNTDVNSSGFGVAIAPIGGTNFKESGTASVDHIRITVTYTASGSVKQSQTFIQQAVNRSNTY